MSDSQSVIYIIEPNPQMQGLLARAIKDHHLEYVEIVDAPPDSDAKAIVFDDGKSGMYHIEKPYYFASLFNVIKRLEAHQDKNEIVVLGRYVLDVIQNSISTPHDDNPVKLTEKERDILLLLQGRLPEEVPKDVLLDQVWGYGAQIETHTLETHIYRLRQKIEKDSSKPEFLITNEKGYTLVI